MKNIKTIAIVGLGLMGGSLAAACRKRFPKAKVIGISRDRTAIRLALQKKWIHEGTPDFSKGIPQADLIVLCTPVDTLQDRLALADRFAKPGALVTDVGSVKGEIVRWANRVKLKNVLFVGAHPLVGSHERGMQAARADLYDRGFTFVIRSPRANAYKAVKAFWKSISPRVIEVTAEAHDSITAEISHLPHLVASCLTRAVSAKSLSFSGMGFADTTRIAQGHPSVWIPIFQSNQKAVLHALKRFSKELQAFQDALQKPGAKLEKFLSESSRRRRQISL